MERVLECGRVLRQQLDTRASFFITRVSVAIVAIAAALTLSVFAIRYARWPIPSAIAAAPRASDGPTIITITPAPLRTGAKRLGINLGAEDFYSSLQILKNLVSRNPGFEGLQWQTIVRCGQVTSTSCSDAAQSGLWPEGFLDGGTYEVIFGTASGQTGTIAHSTASNAHTGSTIQFLPGAKTLTTNDIIVVRKTTAGDAASGWGVQPHGGATVATEFKDLSPRTPGVQAVRVNASGPGQYLFLNQYFDSTPGRSYVQFRGSYVIHFRAKLLKGSSALSVYLERAWTGSNGSLFKKVVPISPVWQDYSFTFTATEPTSAVGTVAFGFNVAGADILLDDVSVEEAAENGTVFRNDVVATLARLRPGVLRYMDSGQNWGSSLDNMLAPQSARRRSGFNRYLADSGDIPIGLHDFLVLSAKLGAEPWYSMQIGMSEQEAANLLEYLGGPVSTRYGAVRAALGHPVPWTQTFSTIHLEYGNEAWNDAQSGASIPDAAAYAGRATTIFHAIRFAPAYSSDRFDLIANGQAVNPYLNAAILEKTAGLDTIDIAPYTFGEFSDDSSSEKIFGPMLAQPEMIDSAPTGIVRQTAEIAAKAARPVRVAVYETNIGTVSGTANQASLDSTVPSIGAGLASVEHMLLMLRDLGITVQNTFQLGGGDFHFVNTATHDGNETSPVWAVVRDMGGPTNRVRPSFLAQELANAAIRPIMLKTATTGADPKWDQPLSKNDQIHLNGAHELQVFAFVDSSTTSLILFNLSRTQSHPVGFDGACAPAGSVSVRTLTSAKITDSNEQEDRVTIAESEFHDAVPGKPALILPPFSMTTLSSNNRGCLTERH